MGHNRLSINDLPPDGEQPMHSTDNSVHAVIDGEIHDYDRIRAELLAANPSYRFKGGSDGELVIALYQAYGAPGFIEHLRGEFAFVLYDERAEKVIAVRDRFGIKPLFWTFCGEGDERRLLIAAEAKAFLSFGWQAEWDVDAIMSCDWAMADRTLFKGVEKVLPGYWMEVSMASGDIKHHRYWDMVSRGVLHRLVAGSNSPYCD